MNLKAHPPESGRPSLLEIENLNFLVANRHSDLIPNAVESQFYASQSVQLWRNQQGEVSAIRFHRMVDDPAVANDWIELIQKDSDSKLLGVVSASAMMLWTHFEHLCNPKLTRFWLTPDVDPASWLAFGFQDERENIDASNSNSIFNHTPPLDSDESFRVA
jgi:hypothetical protein